MNWLPLLPWSMVWLRVLLCPLILLGSYCGWDGKWLSLIVLIALIDDIYDGILARRWGCETQNLRRADSAADTIFYLGVAGALWLREPHLLRDNRLLLSLLAFLEVTRHLFDRIKFARAASYHSYLAKAWGLVMAAAVVAALGFGGPDWLITASLLLGITANAEGLAMSIILPRWQNDVKTIHQAIRLRQTMLPNTPSK